MPDLSYCETLVRDEDHDRFLATLFAPAPSRPWLYALYAFDLETARVSGRVNEPLAGEIRLQWWRDVISGGVREQAAGSPVAAALVGLIEHCPAASERLIGIVEARREGLYAPQPETLPQLEDRFAKSGGAVFEIAALVLAVPADDAISSLSMHAGIAFGLTRYLESSAGAPDRASVVLANSHLDEARAKLVAAPVSAWPAFLVLALVRPSLRSLEHGGRLLQWRKQWALWRAARNLPARI